MTTNQTNKFYSQASQDKFVATLFNYKQYGSFIDIGSSSAVETNNTYFLESELLWKGICIEKDSSYNDGYKIRTCQYINEDALKVDYLSRLTTLPFRIDYLSIDINEHSAEVLKVMPFSDYRFNVITIEHDAYALEDSLRIQERQFLNNHSYLLLCSNVLIPTHLNLGINKAFEDWWVDPIAFQNYIVGLCNQSLYPDQIMELLLNVIETTPVNL